MTSLMLGLKKNVKKTPLATMMTNEYIAISPIRKVQWSGKTFFIAFDRKPAPPNRSSNALPALDSGLGAVAIAALRSWRPPDRLGIRSTPKV